MSLKRRVEKLEPEAHRRWFDIWVDSYMHPTIDRMPRASCACLVVATEPQFLQNLSPEERARFERYSRELYATLGLDHDTWEAWRAEVMAAEPAYYEGKESLYHLTPARLPKPPSNPLAALAVVQRWDYPPTLEGYCQAAIALALARAVVLSELLAAK